MAQPLVECIPNFSEGRRPEVIQEIIRSIESVEGVVILDRHSDSDHNRTVVTALGDPDAMLKGMFNAISRAAELIDMENHQGVHPRIGATDVVPFVPIRDISMPECVDLAIKLGKRVADELAIPVYFYEEAATSPERVNLEYHRRGQYEGLKVDISTQADRKPDLGPEKLGRAGAVVIGAREALIAFNVYLNSDDVGVAKSIAKSVRFSSGGLRYVKAMGVLVEGRAQVSMNLTNFRKTPVARVLEMVKNEAVRCGTSIHHCELVGLIPQEALTDAAIWYTQIAGFEQNQILENRLMVMQQSEPFQEFAFLDELASSKPTPGGGSAAAFAAAQAAALTAMVAGLTIGKKKYADVEKEMQSVHANALLLKQQLTGMVEKDAKAFIALMAAYKLPAETQEEIRLKEKQIKQATFEAARIPLETVKAAFEVLVLAAETARKGNLNAITDAGTGAALARAAIASAGANVRINLNEIKDDPDSMKLLATLEGLEKQAVDLYRAISQDIQSRSGIPFL